MRRRGTLNDAGVATRGPDAPITVQA